MLVSFDMDGTLIRNTNSMELVCGLNGEPDIAAQTFHKIIVEKSLDWVEGDHVTAKYMKGAVADELNDWFGTHAKLIEGIEELVSTLASHGIDSIVVTSGPIEVAKCLKRRFPFKEVYGSIYEIEDGCFTGEITGHIMHSGGKYGCIEDYCKKHGLKAEDTIVIGDSYSDIEVFEKCRRSIALNGTDDLGKFAAESFRTEDIRDLLPKILEWSE